MSNNIVILQLLEILKNNKEVIDKSPLSFMDIHGIFYNCDSDAIDPWNLEDDIKPVTDSISKILKDTSYYYEIDFVGYHIHIYQLNDTLEVK